MALPSRGEPPVLWCSSIASAYQYDQSYLSANQCAADVTSCLTARHQTGRTGEIALGYGGH
jgi:hypothetical protein